MSQRGQALGRIWALLWIWTIGYLLVLVVSVVAIIWALIDLAWQLATGRNDLREDSTPARAISSTLEWSISQTVYGLTGGGDGRWRALPTA